MTLYKLNGEVLKRIPALEPPRSLRLACSNDWAHCIHCPEGSDFAHPVSSAWHRFIKGHWPRRIEET